MQLHEEKKARFEIRELEARIAPGAALAGLTNALESADTGVAAVDAARGAGAAQAIIDNILASNPESGAC